MSEPLIIDYYNDLPNGVYVIEKLNIEYNNLEEKYNELEKKYNELKEEKDKIKKNHPDVYRKILLDKNINLDEFKSIERNNYREIKQIIYNTLDPNDYGMINTYLSDTLIENVLPKYLKYLTNDTDLLYLLPSLINEDMLKIPFDISQGDAPVLGNIEEKIFNSLTRDELTEVMISECEKSFRKIKDEFCICICNKCNKKKDWHDFWDDYDKFICLECKEEIEENS